VLEALKALESKGLVIKVQQANGTAYTLPRDTADVSAADVVSTLRAVIGEGYSLRDEGRWAPVDTLLDQAEAVSHAELDRVSLLELVERCEADAT
jgi:DNA-binding IscR family transcriptional regulator